MLTRVTLTGADDAVDPAQLVELSQEFPFVEWGILFSPKRTGKLRYPTRSWVENLLAVAPDDMALSAHLCGGYASMWIEGRPVEGTPPSRFQRIQLNGYVAHELLAWLARSYQAGTDIGPTEFILQVREKADLQIAATQLSGLPRASILYDPSGGRGIEAVRWPTPPHGVRLGYAGGIRPDTVTDVLGQIGPLDNPYWIDMESGVRTSRPEAGDDYFDLGLVRSVLERAAPYVVSERP